MPQSDDRRYFIVKHDLESFTRLPEFVWRTGRIPEPKRFDMIRKRDLWIAFAYIDDEFERQPLSLVTGFYECTQTKKWRQIPLSKKDLCEAGYGNTRYAWMIKGKRCGGYQPREPVSVPIYDLLDGRVYQNQAIIPGIGAEAFHRIRKKTIKLEHEIGKIPIFGREPYYEQELLAITIACRNKLGIEIIKAGKGFPDLFVKIEGHRKEVHLELEICSRGFISYCHHDSVRNGKLKGTDIDVGVLCWIDDDKDHQVRKCVHAHVYELRSLLRENHKIIWHK